MRFPICRSLRVMSWRHRGFTWNPRSSLTKEKKPIKLASGFCIPEPLPVHTGIKGDRCIHWLDFCFGAEWMRRVLISTKPFIFVLFLVGVTVRSAESLSSAIPLGTSTKRAWPVPPAERRQGFYSPYFIVPKKRGGLRPILDLRVLNRALHKLPLKMQTHRRIIKCIQPQDWFAAIDLKDAYFHVSILLRHRPFLRFAFEGQGMAVQGPPLRALPVSPCVHKGCRRRPYPVTGGGCQDPQLPWRLAYPSPIQRAVGRSQGLGAPASQPIGASGQLGKEQALPCAENLFSWCGVRLGEYDGTASRRKVPKQCWTAWVPSEAGMWYHWNSFRGSWGIWHPQLQSRRSDCFIWDHFSTGYTPGSRGGHDAAVHCE